MGERYNKHTPSAVVEWLRGEPLAFPREWTLYQVAEESHRRYLSKRSPGEISAVRGITRWGAYKLATSDDFDVDCWGWIVGEGPYAPQDHYMRLSCILEPAIAHGPAWRSSDEDRRQLLKKIGDKAREFLDLLETERRLDVDFQDVVGLRPDMQPLLDRSYEITAGRTEQIQRWQANRRDGRDDPWPASQFPGFVGGPRLSDYLAALLAKLLGEGKRAAPNYGHFLHQEGGGEPSLPDEVSDEVSDEEDGWDAENSALMELLGVNPVQAGPLDPNLLRNGGEFGKYPGHGKALRNAVIRAFPAALFDRMTEPPKATPARVIEAACMAWFGESPSQKEINGVIKVDRDRLKRAMMRSINSAKKSAERRAAWTQEGLSESEMWRRELQTFIGEE